MAAFGKANSNAKRSYDKRRAEGMRNKEKKATCGQTNKRTDKWTLRQTEAT